MIKYFYDLPVYRLSRDEYYKARDVWVESKLFPSGSALLDDYRELAKKDPTRHEIWRSHFERSYGGCWEFNEIVGYIRLHFLGTQVRGEYYAVNKKRIVRTRKKTLEYMDWKLAPEVEIAHPYNRNNILTAIREYIDDCRKEIPRRFIDTGMFDSIAEAVDWVKLFKERGS